MTTTSALATVEREAPDVLTQYEVTAAHIAAIKAECAGLSFDTPAAYEAGRVMLGRLRSGRTTIEKRRKALKAEHLERGRKIDAVAHVLTGLIEEIEAPLQAQKDAVDQAKEQARKEAEKAELLALEAKLKAEREEAEAKAKAEREAEEKRLAEERARHEADRAAFAKAQEEAEAKRQAEQAALNAQRAEVEAQQRALAEQQAAAARADEERQAKIRAEEEAKAAAERARVQAERAAAAAASEAVRLEAMRPDIEKVRGWAPAFLALAESAPEVTAPEAQSAIAWVVARLLKTAEALEGFEPETAGS